MKNGPTFFILFSFIFLTGHFAVSAHAGDQASPETLAYYEEVLQTSHNLAPKGALPGSTRKSCGYCHTQNEIQAFMGTEPPMPEELAPLEKDKTIPEPEAAMQKALWNPSAPPFSSDELRRPKESGSLCLSCHDGVLGADIHGKNPKTGKMTDHPVNIPYPRKPTGQFAPALPLPNEFRYWSIPDKTTDGIILPTGPTSDYYHPINPSILSVRTYSGKIGCGSCHNPHTSQSPAYLRGDPKTLCLVCHIR